MTDAELVTALGWQPCKWVQYDDGDSLWWECRAHSIGGWADHPEVCSTIAERIRYVRAGIYFARAEIADAIQRAKDEQRQGAQLESSQWWLAQGLREAWTIARGWGW